MKLRVFIFALLILVMSVGSVFATMYRDTDNRFSLQVPNGWDMTNNNGTIIFNSSEGFVWGARISISVEPHAINNEKDDAGIPVRVVDEGDITINDFPGKYTLSFIGANGNFKNTTLTLFIGDKDYIFSYSSPPNIHSKYSQNFREFVDSFRHPVY